MVNVKRYKHLRRIHRHADAYRGGVCVDVLSDMFNSLLKCGIIAYTINKTR